MKQKECALCDIRITDENDSKEHVIPNAIGGRKKITGFICSDCNSKSGDIWESELAKQLNSLNLFFGISRERGSVPSQMMETTGGESYQLNSDGSMNILKPVYRETPLEAGVHININARSMQEARSMLKGVKRKYPQANLYDLLDNAQVISSYCTDMLHFSLSFGGQKAGRSIVKSALALAVEAGVDPKQCEHARNYLLNEEGEACFGYYYEKDLIKNRPEGIPLHCVYVRGNPSTCQLLSYVEFFGVQRMVLCLSDNYIGQDFTNSYAINPIDGSELNLEVELNLSSADIEAAYNYERIPNGSVEAAFDQVISTGMEFSYQKEKSRIIKKAVEYALANCGEKSSDTLTPENIKKLTALIMQQLEPFILHQFSKRRNV